MAKSDGFFVKFEIEPIVKVDCVNIKCFHNMHRVAGFYCNLKFININEEGRCKSFRIEKVET